MARRMEDLLAAAVPPRSLSVPPPAPQPPLESFHNLARETTLVGMPTLARKTSAPPAEAPRSAPSEIEPSSPPRALSLRVLSQRPLSSPLLTRPHAAGEVPKLLELTREARLSFPVLEGMTLADNGLALVRVTSTFAARVSAIHLMAAEPPGFTTAPLMRRMRNRALDLPLGGQADRLVSLAGAGTLALAPPPGERLVVFEMEGEFLFVRETILVGFAATLTYENGRLAAFEGEAAVLVQLRGHGGVVLRADGELAATEVRAESGVILARDAILGWAGRLIPRELSDDESPAGVKGLVSFSGEGWVLSATRLRGPVSAAQKKAFS